MVDLQKLSLCSVSYSFLKFLGGILKSASCHFVNVRTVILEKCKCMLSTETVRRKHLIQKEVSRVRPLYYTATRRTLRTTIRSAADDPNCSTVLPGNITKLSRDIIFWSIVFTCSRRPRTGLFSPSFLSILFHFALHWTYSWKNWRPVAGMITIGQRDETDAFRRGEDGLGLSDDCERSEVREEVWKDPHVHNLLMDPFFDAVLSWRISCNLLIIKLTKSFDSKNL